MNYLKILLFFLLILQACKSAEEGSLDDGGLAGDGRSKAEQGKGSSPGKNGDPKKGSTVEYPPPRPNLAAATLPITVDSFCSDFNKRRCQLEAFCTGMKYEVCLKIHDCTERVAAIQGGISGGTITFDAANAGSCLGKFDQISCLDFSSIMRHRREFGLCDGVFTGTKTKFDPSCSTHEECVHGHCDDTTGCPGHCVEGPSEMKATECGVSGGRLTSNGECRHGLACLPRGSANQPACVPTWGGEGEPCGSEFLIRPSERCEEGLYCDNASGLCRKKLEFGNPCSAPDACEDKLFCSSNICVYQVDEFGSCEGGEICNKEKDLRCILHPINDRYVCAKAGWNNFDCTSGACSVRDCCGPNFRCDINTKQCAKSRGSGEVCENDLFCSRGYKCVDKVCTCSEKGKCWVPPGTQENCYDFATYYAPYLQCVAGGAFEATWLDGHSLTADAQCYSGTRDSQTIKCSGVCLR